MEPTENLGGGVSRYGQNKNAYMISLQNFTLNTFISYEYTTDDVFGFLRSFKWRVMQC